MLDEMAIAELRSTLRGCLLTPTDPGFEEDCVADRLNRQPDLIVHPAEVLDVIHTIRFVRDSKLEIWVCRGACFIAEVS
jgi:hypothetical protein